MSAGLGSRTTAPSPDPVTRYSFASERGLYVKDEDFVAERAARAAAEEALRQVAEAFTRWSEDANDGTYALYRADDRLTYWKDDDLMAACLNARKVLAAVGDNTP